MTSGTEGAASATSATSAISATGDPVAAAGPGTGRGRRPWRAAFIMLAGIGIIAAAAWALLGSRLLIVKSVTVTGTHLVSPAQVIATAGVRDGTPLIRVDTARVTQRVEAIRQVASARVTKDWPDGLTIAVQERVPVLAIRMAAGGYDLVDHDGVIVRWSRARPAGLPLFLTTLPGSGLRGSQGVATTSAVLGELPSWLSRLVTEVAVSGASGGSAIGNSAPGNRGAGTPASSGGALAPTTSGAAAGPDEVTLYLTGGRTVVWGGTDRAGDKTRELTILLRQPARYFDVSAPGTAITR